MRCELRDPSLPRASQTTSSAWPGMAPGWAALSAIRIVLPSITSARVVMVPRATWTIESGS